MSRPGLVSPTTTTTTLLPLASRKTAALPRVLIFSERNAYRLNYLEDTLKGRAELQSINIADEPELTSFYGISSFPAVVVLSAAGKIVYKHEGDLVNKEIIKRVAALHKS
ncbi:MAG TPA: hypothetical protein VMT55_01425 [Candidatus Sulfotelmatobacter sp.]|nr:hypothetical protein [Candidatus Sulfotelmatobacter sp.]